MTKILRFFSLSCSWILLLLSTQAFAYDPELGLYSRVGLGALEWGFKFYDYFNLPSPEERNPFLMIRLKQEEHKIKRKPVRSRLHWRLEGQLVSLTSDYTADAGVKTQDWINSFRLGLGYRATRDWDVDFHWSAEAAPGIRLATGGLEMDITWFLKLPKTNDPTEKTQLVNPMDLKKIKFEKIQAQDYEDEDPEAPKLARYRAPRMDLKFSAGTFFHLKEKGDPLRLIGYESQTSATNTVTQIRLGLQSKVKWDKRWYSTLDLAYYNYPKDTTDTLALTLASYTMKGALLTGRFSRHSAVQAFPTFEVGASGLYAISSKKQAMLESWLSFYPFTDLSMVFWLRPSMKFEVTEDWYAGLSLDGGISRGGLILLGGANVSRMF